VIRFLNGDIKKILKYFQRLRAGTLKGLRNTLYVFCNISRSEEEEEEEEEEEWGGGETQSPFSPL
jgi:hypothetical protein